MLEELIFSAANAGCVTTGVDVLDYKRKQVRVKVMDVERAGG